MAIGEELKAENERLRSIIRETLWMACRYAHGRNTYAVGMYNDAAREAQRLGCAVDNGNEPIFALDGDLRNGISNLSPEERQEAVRRWSSKNCIRNFLNQHPIEGGE
jgi:hypothetical protein